MAHAGAKPEVNMEWIDMFREALVVEDVREVGRLTADEKAMVNAGINPVEWAITMGKNKALGVLLKRHMDVDRSFGPWLNTALHVAALNSNLPALKLLLNHRADLEKMNAYMYTPFLTALENSDEIVVHFFTKHFSYWKNALKLNLYVEIHNQCPLRSLIHNQNPRVIKYAPFLLQAGVSPNVKGPSGNTPLLDVMYLRETKAAVTFIECVNQFGADANYFNREGICPLFKAVALDQPILLKALLKNPTLNVNLPNMFYLTPLFYATANAKNLEIVELLLKAGADPTVKASFRMHGVVVDTATALLNALSRGRANLVELFFDYGYCPKRKWFIGTEGTSVNKEAWEKAKHLSTQVPSLKALTRKTLKLSLSKRVRIPSNESLKSLGIPKSLVEFISFY